jgi:exosome complex component RRP46
MSTSTAVLADHRISLLSFSGHQSALAVVSGPTEVRIRDELTDRATLEINYSPLNGTAGECICYAIRPCTSCNELSLTK